MSVRGSSDRRCTSIGFFCLFLFFFFCGCCCCCCAPGFEGVDMARRVWEIGVTRLAKAPIQSIVSFNEWIGREWDWYMLT